MSEQAEVARKIKRASQLLFLQRHREPGVKGWELQKALGKDYPTIIELLNQQLEPVDLEVKVVFDDAEAPKEPTPEQLSKARYFIVSKSPYTVSDISSAGWRIDDLAVLAASIAFLMARRGKAPRKEVEQLLREKFPKWKSEMNLDRFIRRGYLMEGEGEMLYMGWRTRAEVDQKTLLNMIIATTPAQDS